VCGGERAERVVGVGEAASGERAVGSAEDDDGSDCLATPVDGEGCHDAHPRFGIVQPDRSASFEGAGAAENNF
jgi:hypothetical protein